MGLDNDPLTTPAGHLAWAEDTTARTSEDTRRSLLPWALCFMPLTAITGVWVSATATQSRAIVGLGVSVFAYLISALVGLCVRRQSRRHQRFTVIGSVGLLCLTAAVVAAWNLSVSLTAI